MKKRNGSALDALVSGRFRRFTVTVTALQILDHHLDSLRRGVPPSGLSLREIAKGYNRIAESVGKPRFFGSYVQRHTKSGDLFCEEGSRYRFRDELIAGIGGGELKRLRRRIVANIKHL